MAGLPVGPLPPLRVGDELTRKLPEALEKVKTLSGLLSICAWCQRVRDDDGSWKRVEAFVTEHADAQFSHGICSQCFEAVAIPAVVAQRRHHDRRSP